MFKLGWLGEGRVVLNFEGLEMLRGGGWDSESATICTCRRNVCSKFRYVGQMLLLLVGGPQQGHASPITTHRTEPEYLVPNKWDFTC